MVFTIGEMAKKLGVAASTLRYYDKEGLFPYMERSEGGIRVFKESDYEFLKIIHCLKATGMQIKDIKHFIELVLQGDESIHARLEIFQKQKLEVEKQIRELQKALETVKFKCWYYETAKRAGSTAFCDNMCDDELPEDMRKIRAKLRREDTF